MKIYLASRYSRIDELNTYADDLMDAGHVVTSRWLEGYHHLTDEYQPKLAKKFATEDLEDVDTADCLIAFPDEPRSPGGSYNSPAAGEKEFWRHVKESSLGYAVSSWGRVRNGGGDLILGKRVKGYIWVRPSGKVAPGQYVHRLVARAFIGISELEVDHLDGNRANNWKGNLEYVTHLENIQRGEARGARGSRAGEANGRHKLSEADVIAIRADHTATDVSLSRRFVISSTAIRNVRSGKSWSYDSTISRGGQHVEFGYAYATGKRVIIVGPRANVFHYLPGIEHYATWEQCYRKLSVVPHG